MGIFDRPPFDFNGDGKTDAFEMLAGMQMTASSRKEAIDLTGDDTFYIEELPIGTETTTYEVSKQVFGEEVDKYDNFEFHFEVFDEIDRRGNVYLDMSKHEDRVEGLPQFLLFIITKKL